MTFESTISPQGTTTPSSLKNSDKRAFTDEKAKASKATVKAGEVRRPVVEMSAFEKGFHTVKGKVDWTFETHRVIQVDESGIFLPTPLVLCFPAGKLLAL